MNTPDPLPTVEPCRHCHEPAERPAVGHGRIAGQDETHVPLCLACLELLLTDPKEFWRGMRSD